MRGEEVKLRRRVVIRWRIGEKKGNRLWEWGKKGNKMGILRKSQYIVCYVRTAPRVGSGRVLGRSYAT
jgi:hypothetical protein